MIYKRLTKTHIFIAVVALIILIAGIATYLVISPKSELSNKPNPNPGSGKSASPASRQAEAKKLSQTKELNKMLAEAPKDPKSQCLVVSRFNSEQTRNDMLDIENKRHDSAVQKNGSNNAENYIHKQNLAKIQKQFEQSNNSNNCK